MGKVEDSNPYETQNGNQFSHNDHKLKREVITRYTPGEFIELLVDHVRIPTCRSALRTPRPAKKVIVCPVLSNGRQHDARITVLSSCCEGRHA